ncbi:MAG: ATP-dependent DNA helicase RecG [Candidatus Obscuribacterales bacterium]|nr:ATP-dependent DNA helicase RecG [Candidatus Obscuribacterales bacterium]
MGPFGAVPIDKDAEIASLQKAMEFERRARYTNFKGKSTTFAEFMRRSAERLSKRFPLDSRWSTLRGLFRQYPNLDVGARISIIRRTEELLFGKAAKSDEPAASPKVHMHFEPDPSKHYPVYSQGERPSEPQRGASPYAPAPTLKTPSAGNLSEGGSGKPNSPGRTPADRSSDRSPDSKDAPGKKLPKSRTSDTGKPKNSGGQPAGRAGSGVGTAASPGNAGSARKLAKPDIGPSKPAGAGKPPEGSSPLSAQRMQIRQNAVPDPTVIVSAENRNNSVNNAKEKLTGRPVRSLEQEDAAVISGRDVILSPLPNYQNDNSAKRPEKSNNSSRPAPAPSTKNEDPQSVNVQYVKGVGPKMAELLARLDIHTAEDLIRHYPRQHLDFQHHMPIRNVRPGEDVTIFGTIKSVGAFQSKKGNISIVSILINDGTGSITVSKFIGGKSNKYLLDRYKNSYPKGAQVMASGRAERDSYGNRLQLKNAELEILGNLAGADEEIDSLHAGRLVPVYPLTDGLSLRVLRSIIHSALETHVSVLNDPLPPYILEQSGLLDLQSALWGIHFPENEDQKEAARKRLVFDELLSSQLQLAMRRHRFQSQNEAIAMEASEGKLITEFRKLLPFKLTGAQERVFGEIASDLASEHPMHRLVQGDVGSGKTVVAAMASLVAVENGFQAAVMAPTEILAEQHFRQFQRWLTPLGLNCALLLGKQGVKERRQVQQGLQNGQVHVAIGTHALIQDDVEFRNLGFVVIDEQHRFGVKQRAQLKAKGKNPELLTMTATPIPRTLALTLHGDLDVSEIDELPPGRKPIKTELVKASGKRDLHANIKMEILKGRQVYIVFPLIEESETLSAKAATAEFEKLQTSVFPEYKIGLMHGKLKPEEKDKVMEEFRKGEFQILVSTTVIEVGVDVPNATVMVIENADRFGLAQLHQLRGRVGRGGEQSYCYLVADVKSEMTRQRLGIMCQTNDGFVIAEKDLELRGPGEFLGVRQSGMPDLLLADIVKDAKILEEARKIAIEIVKEDPELEKHQQLKRLLSTKNSGEKTDLISSG